MGLLAGIFPVKKGGIRRSTDNSVNLAVRLGTAKYTELCMN